MAAAGYPLAAPCLQPCAKRRWISRAAIVPLAIAVAMQGCAGIGDVSGGEYSVAGGLHVAVDLEIAVCVHPRCQPAEPGVIRVRLVAEQQQDVVDVDVRSVVEPQAQPAGFFLLLECCDRASRHHRGRSGCLVPAQPLDQQRLRPRLRRAHDQGCLHAPLGQHARDVEGVVSAADHGNVRSGVGARLAGPGRAEVDAVGEPSRITDALQPVLAAETRSGRDYQGPARQGPSRGGGRCELECKGVVAFAPDALRAGTGQDLDPRPANMSSERLGIVAGGFSRSAEQPFVGVGARVRHAAESGAALDDHGREPVVGEPQRAGHAGRSAADDRHDHCSSAPLPPFHGPRGQRGAQVARRLMVRQSRAARKPDGRFPARNA